MKKSGSPVIHEETGHAVAIHTHGGCSSGGNHGTRIDQSDFAAHINFLTKTCTQDSDCSDGRGCNGEYLPYYLLYMYTFFLILTFSYNEYTSHAP